MSLTLGLTGMDPATEAALKAAFVDANARLNGHWQLLPEAEAKYVVVDMDSMYGPMSWLRLHAAGKRVIGLTTAPRTQTDFRLGRPFDGNQVAVLLREVAADGGVDLSVKAAGTDAAASKPVDMPPEIIRTASASVPPLVEAGKVARPATVSTPETPVAPSTPASASVRSDRSPHAGSSRALKRVCRLRPRTSRLRLFHRSRHPYRHAIRSSPTGWPPAHCAAASAIAATAARCC